MKSITKTEVDVLCELAKEEIEKESDIDKRAGLWLFWNTVITRLNSIKIQKLKDDNLHQCACSTHFEYLVQLVNKEHKMADELENTTLKELHLENVRATQRILRIIRAEKQMDVKR